MKAQLFTCILLAGSLYGCRTRQTTIFLEQASNRDFAKIACEIYKHDHNIACIKTPKQMATDMTLRLALAVLQNPACKHVTISYTPVGEENMKSYLAGQSLTFNVAIDGGDIDYSNSNWWMLDNKTKKRFEGPLKNSVEAATQICVAATQ
jgi:hypothetical protein